MSEEVADPPRRWTEELEEVGPLSSQDRGIAPNEDGGEPVSPEREVPPEESEVVSEEFKSY